MATAIPSNLLKSIHGKVGNVVFYVNRGTQCVRTYVIPRNPDTESQRVIRRMFADAVRSWQSMDSEQQYIFTRKARHTNMSGYNLYISYYLTKLLQSLTQNSTSEPNSKTPTLARNLEPATFNLSPLPKRIHSVSNTKKKANRQNPASQGKKTDPG
jgi:hypothetical protein